MNEQAIRAEALKAISPASPAGALLARNPRLVRCEVNEDMHDPSCPVLVSSSDRTQEVDLVEALAWSTFACGECAALVSPSGTLSSLLRVIDVLSVPLLNPSAVRFHRAELPGLLSDGLEALLPHLEALWRASDELRERIEPHARALLDLMASLAVHNAIHPYEKVDATTLAEVRHLFPEYGLDPFVAELLTSTEPKAPWHREDVRREAGRAVLETHRLRRRPHGDVILATKEVNLGEVGLPFGLEAHVCAHLAYAREHFLLPGRTDMGLFPAAVVPGLVHLERPTLVAVLDASALTDEVLETFLVLRRSSPDADAFRAAQALA